MSTVIVFCPNAHQYKVKVYPGKPMKEVLIEACLHQGYDVDLYGLQFQRRFIDLSLPFRLSGLPNNAHLELIENPMITQSPVKIALHTPYGRFEQDIGTDQTLWDVLQIIETANNINLTKCEDVDNVPSISFMQKTFKGQLQLSQTKLKAMGVEGRVLFRYLQIKLSLEEREIIKEEFESNKLKQDQLEKLFLIKRSENEERIRLQKKFEDEVLARTKGMNIEQSDPGVQASCNPSQSEAPMDAMNPTNSQESTRLHQLESVLSTVSHSLNDGRVDDLADRLMTDSGSITLNPPPPFQFTDFKFPDQPVATIGDLLRLEEESGLSDVQEVEIPDRHALLYSPEPKRIDVEVDDSFFDLTVEDAKRLQRELREEVKRNGQQSLLPVSFVESRNKRKKKHAYKNTVIRAKLTEKIIVQARFSSMEPVQNLFKFVSQVIRSKEFDLVAVLRIDKDSMKDMIDEGLAPSSTVTVNLKDGTFSEELINYDLLTRVSEEEALSDAEAWLAVNSNYIPDKFLVDGAQPSDAGVKRNYDEPINRSPNSGPSLPKWLKRF